VSWNVFSQDGSSAVLEIQADRVPAAACRQLGGTTAERSMFAAAVRTGQIGASAVHDSTTGLQGACERGEVFLYYGTLLLSNEQPCGQYRIDARATSAGGAAVLSGSFDVLCFYYLQFDFDRIDWGTLGSGDTEVLQGDFVLGGPPGNAPTVRNVGNDGVALGVQFSPLVRVDSAGSPPSGSAAVDQFGACFGRTATSMQCGTADPATGRLDFDEQRERVLCANEAGRLDLSVQTRPGLALGQYVGSLQIQARPAAQAC
jgi:hypothetical protein